jgi:hypothetical protein
MYSIRPSLHRDINNLEEVSPSPSVWYSLVPGEHYSRVPGLETGTLQQCRQILLTLTAPNGP